MSQPPSKVTYAPTPRVGKRFVREEESYVPATVAFTAFDKKFLKGCNISATHTVGS